MLIDTGASISVIPKNLVKMLKTKIYKTEKLEILCPNGIIKINEFTVVEINYNQVKLFIIDNNLDYIIIGRDNFSKSTSR